MVLSCLKLKGKQFFCVCLEVLQFVKFLKLFKNIYSMCYTVFRLINREDVVIIDAGNYIKGKLTFADFHVPSCSKH